MKSGYIGSIKETPKLFISYFIDNITTFLGIKKPLISWILTVLKYRFFVSNLRVVNLWDKHEWELKYRNL
jgi:hypothetical protein